MKIKFGLIAKYGLAVSLIVVLISIIHSIFMFKLESIRSESSLKEHGLTLARNLAYASEYGVLSGNILFLERVVKDTQEKEKEAAYVQILDRQGKILVQFSRKIEARIPVFNFEYPIKSLKVERPAEEIGLAPLAPASGEIKEEIIGNVKLGISHAKLFTERNQLLAITSALTFSIIAAGLLGIYLMTGYLLIAPLKQFVGGTRKIAEGDLTYKIQIKSHDEIGDLASSFNVMTESLKKSKDQIETYAKNLEHLVRERTRELEESVEKLKQTAAELEYAKTGLETEVAKKTEELEKEKVSLEEKVKEKTADLQAKIAELEEFHKLAVGRELKMMELEKKIEVLEGGPKAEG